MTKINVMRLIAIIAMVTIQCQSKPSQPSHEDNGERRRYLGDSHHHENDKGYNEKRYLSDDHRHINLWSEKKKTQIGLTRRKEKPPQDDQIEKDKKKCCGLLAKLMPKEEILDLTDEKLQRSLAVQKVYNNVQLPIQDSTHHDTPSTANKAWPALPISG
ncbi:uncharacterized protein LOC144349936 [Saccoglossus kowalevskii]